MSFLTPSEHLGLQIILKKNNSLRGTITDRQDLFAAVGLTEIANEINLDRPLDQVTIPIVNRLAERAVTQEGENKIGLVWLLEYLLSEDKARKNPTLNEKEWEFLEEVIRKGKNWLNSPEYEQKDAISAALDAGLAGLLDESPPPPVRYKVDKGLITDYDMEELTEFISQGTKKYEGLVTFLLEGFEDGYPTPIEHYFLERILADLKARKKSMSWCIYDIPLSEDDLGAGEDWIERKLVNMLKYERVDDLFSGAHQNIVLCIFNNEIPREVTAERIVPFLKKIQAAAPAHLENKGRLLVLIFLDTGAQSSTGLPKLPLPGKFDVTSLCAWLHANLLEAQVPEDKIAAYKKRLSKWNGQVLNTYTEMDGIIKELRGG